VIPDLFEGTFVKITARWRSVVQPDYQGHLTHLLDHLDPRGPAWDSQLHGDKSSRRVMSDGAIPTVRPDKLPGLLNRDLSMPERSIGCQHGGVKK